MPLAFIAVMGMQAQTTIVEEKIDKYNFPIAFNLLPKSNKLVIQKGSLERVIPNSLMYVGTLKTLIEYKSDSEKKILLDDVEVVNCNISNTETGFYASNITKSFLDPYKTKFYSESKTSDIFEYDKIENYKFSDNYGFYISNNSGRIAEQLNGKNLSLEVLDIYKNKFNSINFDLPNLNRLQGDNLLNQVAGGARSNAIKDRGIGYKLNILDNEYFEIVTKGINKDYKSMTLYRTIYDIQGKMVQDLKYTIDLKGLYLVNSFNNGGDRYISGGTGGYRFNDDLSINNYIIDKNTNDIFVYGLFGKESENSPSGYYVFRFSNKGEKIYESINFINDKAFQEGSFKPHLRNTLTINGNKLLFMAGVTKVMYKRFYSFNYSLLDIDNGKELNSKFIEYDTNFKGLRTIGFKETIHSNKELKDKALDMNTYVLYDYNSKVKKYINSVTATRNIFFNSEISNEGIWLMETDMKNYYKVTYFEHN